MAYNNVMSDQYTELSRPFAETDREIALPFQRVVRGAYGMVDPDFRSVRADLNSIKPPILVCDDEPVAVFADSVLSSTAYTPHEKGNIFYDAGVGVIFASKGKISRLIQNGKPGEAELQLILLEEIVHAYTTYPDYGDSNQNIRIGCIRTPIKRTWHTLQPGYIYAYDLARQEGIGEEEGYAANSEDLHVTEHLTRYLAWSYLTKHAIQPRFPMFTHVLMSKEGVRDFRRLIPIDKKHMQAAHRILHRGDPRAGELVWPVDVLHTLRKPQVNMFVTTQFPVKDSDIVDFESLR